MKRLCVVICSAVLLAGLVSQPAVGRSTASTSEATKVRTLLLYQMAQFNQARWRTLWQTYTPRVRSRCTFRQFVTKQKASRAAVGRVSMRNIAVRVRGTRAFVVYQILAQGRVVGVATARNPDIYARLGGRWLDDVDDSSPC